MKIKVFLSFFLMILQSLNLSCSQQINSSQIFDLHEIASNKDMFMANQDYSIIAYCREILENNKTLLHEQLIHNKILENLYKQLRLEESEEKKLKISTSIKRESARFEKVVGSIFQKIINCQHDIPEGTPVLQRPSNMVRAFSPDNSDEDNQ